MSYPVVQHVIQRLSGVRATGRSVFFLVLPWLLLLLQSCVVIALLRTSCTSPLSPTPHALQLHPASCQQKPCPTTPEPDLKMLVQDTRLDHRIQEELPVQLPAQVSRVFYNRVPKCGSSTMMDLLTTMGELHNFTFIRSGIFMTFFLQEPERKWFAESVLSYSPPVVYERHFHFLNFKDYRFEQPVYFNLVRDPLERLVSWYYFRRFQQGHIRDMNTEKRYRTYDECVLRNHSECVEPRGDDAEEGYFKLIPFFCGQDKFCREPSEKAIVQAIFNVKQYYAVVGVLEEYSKFIEVLEYVLPSYFRGAPKVFDALSQKWKKQHRTTYKLPVSDDARRIMEKKLKLEYQFYDFLKDRILNVHKAMADAKRRLLL